MIDWPLTWRNEHSLMQTWFPVINHCTSRVDHSSKIGIHCSKTQITAIFNGTFHETSMCQHMCVLQGTEVPFLGRIQPSISNCCTDSSVTLSTLSNVCGNAGSDQSSWQSQHYLGHFEGAETIEMRMSGIQWSLDACSLLFCGKILNLGEFCHTS